MKYGLVSLVSVVVAKFFDGKYSAKNNFIEHIVKMQFFIILDRKLETQLTILW